MKADYQRNTRSRHNTSSSEESSITPAQPEPQIPSNSESSEAEDDNTNQTTNVEQQAFWTEYDEERRIDQQEASEQSSVVRQTQSKQGQQMTQERESRSRERSPHNRSAKKNIQRNQQENSRRSTQQQEQRKEEIDDQRQQILRLSPRTRMRSIDTIFTNLRRNSRDASRTRRQNEQDIEAQQFWEDHAWQSVVDINQMDQRCLTALDLEDYIITWYPSFLGKDGRFFYEDDPDEETLEQNPEIRDIRMGRLLRYKDHLVLTNTEDEKIIAQEQREAGLQDIANNSFSKDARMRAQGYTVETPKFHEPPVQIKQEQVGELFQQQCRFCNQPGHFTRQCILVQNTKFFMGQKSQEEQDRNETQNNTSNITQERGESEQNKWLRKPSESDSRQGNEHGSISPRNTYTNEKTPRNNESERRNKGRKQEIPRTENRHPDIQYPEESGTDTSTQRSKWTRDPQLKGQEEHTLQQYKKTVKQQIYDPEKQNLSAIRNVEVHKQQKRRDAEKRHEIRSKLSLTHRRMYKMEKVIQSVKGYSNSKRLTFQQDLQQTVDVMIQHFREDYRESGKWFKDTIGKDELKDTMHIADDIQRALDYLDEEMKKELDLYPSKVDKDRVRQQKQTEEVMQKNDDNHGMLTNLDAKMNQLMSTIEFVVTDIKKLKSEVYVQNQTIEKKHQEHAAMVQQQMDQNQMEHKVATIQRINQYQREYDENDPMDGTVLRRRFGSYSKKNPRELLKKAKELSFKEQEESTTDTEQNEHDLTVQQEERDDLMQNKRKRQPHLYRTQTRGKEHKPSPLHSAENSGDSANEAYHKSLPDDQANITPQVEGPKTHSTAKPDRHKQQQERKINFVQNDTRQVPNVSEIPFSRTNQPLNTIKEHDSNILMQSMMETNKTTLESINRTQQSVADALLLLAESNNKKTDKNVALPPKFEGKEQAPGDIEAIDINDWIDRMTDAINARGYGEKAAKTTITGNLGKDPTLFITNKVKEIPNLTSEQLLSLLARRYSLTENFSQRRQEFNEATQQQTEDYGHFMDRLILLRSLGGHEESGSSVNMEINTKFVRGLRDQRLGKKLHFLYHAGFDLPSMEETLKTTMQYGRIQGSYDKEKEKRRHNRDYSFGKPNNQQITRDYNCRLCHQKGHFVRDCPLNLSEKPMNTNNIHAMMVDRAECEGNYIPRDDMESRLFRIMFISDSMQMARETGNSKFFCYDCGREGHARNFCRDAQMKGKGLFMPQNRRNGYLNRPAKDNNSPQEGITYLIQAFLDTLAKIKEGLINKMGDKCSYCGSTDHVLGENCTGFMNEARLRSEQLRREAERITKDLNNNHMQNNGPQLQKVNNIQDDNGNQEDNEIPPGFSETKN